MTKYNTFQKILQVFRNVASNKENEKIVERNTIFKNRHKNSRCFIIGNGSSLRHQNLSPVKHEVTFAMNAFWKHPIVTASWQPTYYCFADPSTFDGAKSWHLFFRSLNKKITTSIFFVPVYGKKTIEGQNLLPISQTFYVMFGQDMSTDDMDIIDLAYRLPPVQSTSQLAIELAIYMGCNPIYLLGMDHDWLSHRGKDRHFYSGKTLEDHPVAHGDLAKDSYKSELESCLKLWIKYEELKVIADQKQIKILNATDGGFLDVFPRISYKSLFSL